MSQRELADHLQVAQSAISYWENGTTEPNEEIRERVEAFMTKWETDAQKVSQDSGAGPRRGGGSDTEKTLPGNGDHMVRGLTSDEHTFRRPARGREYLGVSAFDLVCSNF